MIVTNSPELLGRSKQEAAVVTLLFGPLGRFATKHRFGVDGLRGGLAAAKVHSFPSLAEDSRTGDVVPLSDGGDAATYQRMLSDDLTRAHPVETAVPNISCHRRFTRPGLFAALVGGRPGSGERAQPVSRPRRILII